MQYILGVDAGSSKTTAAIAEDTGKILGLGNGGAASIHQAKSKDEFRNNLREAIDGARVAAGIKVDEFAFACFGVAGADTEKSIEKAKELITKVVSIKNLTVYNDLMLVRPACSSKKYGISVIAGTGSNFYGINSEGREEHVGGFDYLLSDEGGAYRIGQRAMSAAAKSFDGRGEKTLLEELLVKNFRVNSIKDLTDIIYDGSFGKYEIAAIARLVDSAYSQGDVIAKSILAEAADEIALGINTLIKKLNLEKEDFDVVVAGGEFRSPFPFEQIIKEKLISGKDNFIVCKNEPVEGAVKLALKQLQK